MSNRRLKPTTFYVKGDPFGVGISSASESTDEDPRKGSAPDIDMKQLDANTSSTTSSNTSSNVVAFMDTLGTNSLLQLPERQTLPSSDIVLSFDDNEFNISSCNNTNNMDTCPAMLDYQQYRHQGQGQGQHRRQLTPMMAVDSYNNGFFSMQTFGGALRKGGAVTLFSKRYYGYALSAACSGYMYVAIEFVLMRFPYSALGIRPQSVQGLKDLLHLQWSIVLALGLLSDSYAPFRYRRNGYILCGWVAVSAFWCALFVFFQFSDVIFGTDLPPANAAIACITGAMLFLVVLTNATDIRVVELSQQEELHRRGRLVATYQILRIGAQVCAHTLVKLSGVSAQYTKRNDVELDVTPNQAKLFILHLGVLSLVPIPFVLRHAREEKLGVHAAKSQFVETCRQFWRSAQQKAIWQLIAFNCVLYFFSFLEYKDVGRALAIWNQQSPEGKLTQSVLSDTTFVIALLLWKWFGVNANWIKTTAGVIVSWTLLYFVGNSLVALDVVRQQPWVAVAMSVLRAGFRVLLLFSAFIPTIEVAQIGSEGTIFGLLSSFQAIVKALGAQLSDAIMDDAEGLQINLRDVAAVHPTSSTNSKVFHWVLVLTGIKLLSLTALFFCPQQKLDAQQLRIYGGYSRVALGVFLVLYALSYPYASYLQYSRLSV